MSRKLVGKDEELTFEEAKSMRDRAMTEFIYYMCSLIEENTEDEEERANAKVMLSEKLGNVMYMSELVGVLTSDGEYLATLKGLPGDAKIEEVEDAG